MCARIPPAGTPDTDFHRGRASQAPYYTLELKANEEEGLVARARRRISWKHRVSAPTLARPRAALAVQSAHRREMGVYVAPAVAYAECGSGVSLLNNVSERSNA